MTECTTRALLMEQFDTVWALAWYHLEELSTEECLWEPSSPCIHVRRVDDGTWHADWPDKETYEMGPPSIAWTTWHICYWWTKAISHLEGSAEVEASDVRWPGNAGDVRQAIQTLRDRWRTLIGNCDEIGFKERRENSWPIPSSSTESIAAWLNVELMKNAAEIGCMRFLYAVTPRLQQN